MASPPPSSPPKATRPVTLKLKTTTSSLANPPLSANAMSPPPLSTPSGGGTKIILKRSQPPTPAAIPDGVPMFSGTAVVGVPTPSSALPPSATMTKKGRVSKPTAKKRARDLDDSDDELNDRGGLGRTASGAAAGTNGSSGGGGGGGPPKRPKLILRKSMKPRTASIVVKSVHKEAPPRSLGEGYDSEEEDREIDPLIEEEFVLRMLPGEHCDYLRRMVEERKVGVPVREGGADFQMKWLAGAERRALVTVRGARFVGVLVDLPTITEGMKTWDRRNFMKSADICQMLLVFARVADEAEAKSISLPAMVTKDYRWPHGLTPPMHDCIHRRFRKRLSKKEIKDKEAELQRLLNEDRIAVDSKWELIDDGRGGAAADAEYQDGDMVVDDDDEADADGDLDDEYFGAAATGGGSGGAAAAADDDQQADAVYDYDDAELEAMFEDGDDGETDAAAPATATAASGTAAGAAAAAGTGVSSSVGTGAAAGKPAGALAVGGDADEAKTPGGAGDESDGSDGDGDEDEEDDDDDDDDMDEDELARAEQAKGVREDISELKKQLQVLDRNLAGTQNALLRRRIEENKKRVLSELRLKQASIGELDDEEE